MHARRAAASLASVAIAAGLVSGCSAPAPSPQEPAVDPADQAACAVAALGATPGIRFGVNLDWGAQTVAEYAELLGEAPADVVSFSPVPWNDQERQWVIEAAHQAAGSGSAHLLTLEPQEGLRAVTDEVIADIVAALKQITALGVPVVVRFAHEMNGSWYAWGQQPALYVETYRRVAEAVHGEVPGAAMMWAPNYGGGYPFAGGAYAARAGTPDAEALDLDADGSVTGADDPYAPYYPGDEYVDWVGMSLYHWGSAHPWGENEMPEDGKFAAQLTGAYRGLDGDETAVPDFYAEYGERRAKPVAIPETAALVIERGDPDGERAIQRAWWRQVLSAETADRFPMLRMVNWFEWVKHEPEVDEIVHWSVLAAPTTREQFLADLPHDLRFGPVGCAD
ncbi:glycosyl hydrolase [Microbacterium sp. NPDC096154]|uniref:glycoside hydrolase family 26 protein n=1 Tax=Microbacterium sp. NPDC096154 TaxID=3155549 RepID=UPI003325E7F7